MGRKHILGECPRAWTFSLTESLLRDFDVEGTKIDGLNKGEFLKLLYIYYLINKKDEKYIKSLTKYLSIAKIKNLTTHLILEELKNEK